ncbi:MAG TPA: hypothetical protein VK806_02405 [Bacteroidia bacterium]|jgi:hypothetical protein|nr:hypothetical protein [Bacteroidia bacterium]
MRISSIFILVSLFFTSNLTAQKIWKKDSKLEVGNAQYSLQDYKAAGYKFKARHKFRVLKPFFKKYFLMTNDSVFLKSLDTGACYFCIEPLIINLTTRDGFYTCRIYSKTDHASPLFVNGGFPHWPYLISSGKVFRLGRDSLKTIRIIDSCTTHLMTFFTSDDIKFMKKWGVCYPMWSDNIALGPNVIYNGKNIYIDDKN